MRWLTKVENTLGLKIVARGNTVSCRVLNSLFGTLTHTMMMVALGVPNG
jgi:hypothetical protein